MIETITLQPFTKRADALAYREHLAIKYQVFVDEQRWDVLRDGAGRTTAREDEFDEGGRFWVARSEHGRPVGVVRGIRLRDGFPHRELLEPHLHSEAVRAVHPGGLCTLNGLAVVPEYRGRTCRVEGRSWTGTVARLLMLVMIRTMEEVGLTGVLATSAGIASTRLCRSLGFCLIDAPDKHPEVHETFVMANIGMVFGSPAHVEAQRAVGMGPHAVAVTDPSAIRLLAYFEDRERALLDGQPIERFFP